MLAFHNYYHSDDFCQTVRPFLESLPKEECAEILNEYFPAPKFYLPLTRAVRCKRDDIIALFIGHGADIFKNESKEFSALEEAVILGKLDTCYLMLELYQGSRENVLFNFSPQKITETGETENFFQSAEDNIFVYYLSRNKKKRLFNFLECMRRVVLPLFPWVQDNIVIFLNNNKKSKLYKHLAELLSHYHFRQLVPCKSLNHFKKIKREKALTNIAFIFSNHLADLPVDICKKISTHFL